MRYRFRFRLYNWEILTKLNDLEDRISFLEAKLEELEIGLARIRIVEEERKHGNTGSY